MIVLVGFMGAGKSTVGRLLAAKLGLPFTDSDHVIEERADKPIRRIFADEGESAFRELEHAVIAGLLAGQDAVLALGGGAAGHPATRALLARVPVVYLRVGYAEALARVGGDQGRPMLARPDVQALHAEREAIYASVATVTVGTDGHSPEDIALEVLGALEKLAEGASDARWDDARLRGRLQRGGRGAGRLRAGRPGHRLRP